MVAFLVFSGSMTLMIESLNLHVRFGRGICECVSPVGTRKSFYSLWLNVLFRSISGQSDFSVQ